MALSSDYECYGRCNAAFSTTLISALSQRAARNIRNSTALIIDIRESVKRLPCVTC